MSIEGIGRATDRMAEIATRFGGQGPTTRFHDLLVDAAGSGTEPGAVSSPRSVFAPGMALTIGQMLGTSPIGAAGTVGSPGNVVFPVTGVGPEDVTNSFGWNWGPHKHAGVDIFAPTGTAIAAPVSGEIELAGTSKVGGNRIWLRGDDGRGYYMAHMDGFAPGIEPGARVTAGEIVGFVGNTGDAAGKPPHLHFSISRDADLKPGDSQDPAAAGWLDPGPILGLGEADSSG